MKTITFTCETITPMFLSGADQNTPELRPPSIKGALRFWWRAMNGDKMLSTGDTSLRNLENKLFGGVDSESGGRSPFNIRIANYNIPDEQKEKKSMLPHKSGSFKQSIKEGFSFDVIISFFPEQLAKISVTEQQLKNLFIITCILGGLGKRSRRGFGSIDVKKIDGKPYSTPDSKSEIVNMIKTVNPNFDLGKTHAGVHYPYIKGIDIANESSDNPTLTLGKATHDTKGIDNVLYNRTVGNANPRFSSPVFISVLRGNYIVITTLHTANKNGSITESLKLQQELKNSVLNG
jgi:CRISPR-associated protein Cmr1